MEHILTKNVYNVNPTKATIMALDGPYANIKIDVMFNPNEYSIVLSADVEAATPSNDKKEKKSADKDPFFDKVKLEDFTLKLVLDTYEKPAGAKDVRVEAKKITRLIIPIEGRKKKRPALCLFKWRDFEYKGIITKIDQKFLMFLPDGTPVREEMTLIIKSILNQQEIKKNAGFDACRKAWTVKSGDRLDLIASIELKDATSWRKIAEENEIEDPLNFPLKGDIGRRIIIPD